MDSTYVLMVQFDCTHIKNAHQATKNINVGNEYREEFCFQSSHVIRCIYDVCVFMRCIYDVMYYLLCVM